MTLPGNAALHAVLIPIVIMAIIAMVELVWPMFLMAGPAMKIPIASVAFVEMIGTGADNFVLLIQRLVFMTTRRV